MILSNKEIVNACQEGRIVIDPFNPKQLGVNSYDVRLGNWFILVRATPDFQPNYGILRWVPDGRIAVIDNGTTLAMTKEIIGTHQGIVATLRNRSTTSRMGLSVCNDGGFGDVGYENKWTATLSCHLGSGIIGLEVGKTFAQIVFHETTEADTHYGGQYNDPIFPLAMLPSRYREQYAEFYNWALGEQENSFHPGQSTTYVMGSPILGHKGFSKIEEQ